MRWLQKNYEILVMGEYNWIKTDVSVDVMVARVADYHVRTRKIELLARQPHHK
jgi:hypothetical protein